MQGGRYAAIDTVRTEQAFTVAEVHLREAATALAQDACGASIEAVIATRAVFCELSFRQRPGRAQSYRVAGYVAAKKLHPADHPAHDTPRTSVLAVSNVALVYSVNFDMDQILVK